MSCSACQAAVERAVKKCGAEEVSVNLLNGHMKVTHGEDVSDAAIIAAVEDAGYHATTHGTATMSATLGKEEESRRLRSGALQLLDGGQSGGAMCAGIHHPLD